MVETKGVPSRKDLITQEPEPTRPSPSVRPTPSEKPQNNPSGKESNSLSSRHFRKPHKRYRTFKKMRLSRVHQQQRPSQVRKGKQLYKPVRKESVRKQPTREQSYGNVERKPDPIEEQKDLEAIVQSYEDQIVVPTETERFYLQKAGKFELVEEEQEEEEKQRERPKKKEVQREAKRVERRNRVKVIEAIRKPQNDQNRTPRKLQRRSRQEMRKRYWNYQNEVRKRKYRPSAPLRERKKSIQTYDMIEVRRQDSRHAAELKKSYKNGIVVDPQLDPGMSHSLIILMCSAI